MLQRLKSIAQDLKREFHAYRLVLQNPRTPRTAKVLLGLAVGYLMLPFALIPDFIPVIGQMDDAIIVPALVLLALRMVPAEVVVDCRARARSA